MGEHLTYHQVLAEVYEENARHTLVLQNTYDDDVPPDDTHSEELEDQEDFQKPHGSRQYVEIPREPKVYTDYTTQGVRYKKEVQKRVISIDSRFRSEYAHPATDFLFKLLTPVKNVCSIRLSSIEIPNTFYNFSKNKGNIYMRVYYPSGQTQKYRELMFTGTTIFDPSLTTFKLGIPDGNYIVDFNAAVGPPAINEITNIVSMLQELLNTTNDVTLNPNDNLGIVNQFTVNLVPISLKINISYSGGNFDIDFATNSQFINRQYDWGLGYNLGFRQKTYTGASSYTSESVPDLIGNNYLFLVLDPDWKVVMHMHPDRQQFFSFSKILVTVPKNDLIYDNGSNTVTKEYWLSQPTDIQSFHVRLTDQYEEDIDLVGANMSFTLELSEIMNPSLYEYVRNIEQSD
jgi:hypothetical protein